MCDCADSIIKNKNSQIAVLNSYGKQSKENNSSTEDKEEYCLKILLIGDSGVGKSSILFRYADDIFDQTFVQTIGIDFKIRSMVVDGVKFKLQIWDTAGQERFRTITSSYYRGADGIIQVFDITNQESFSNMNKWNQEIDRYAIDTVVKILVGNKLDLESKRQVTFDEAQIWAKDKDIFFYETSAKTNENIPHLFEQMCRIIKQSY
jgi:small GTP-binding protein